MSTTCPNSQNRKVRLGASAGLLGGMIVAVLVMGTEMKSSWHKEQVAEARRDEALKKAAAALRRAELLIESSDQAMIVCDEDGKITEINKAAETILGWTNRELIGAASGVLVPNDLRVAHLMGMRAAKRQIHEYSGDWLLTSNRRTLRALKKDSSEVETVASVRAIKYDNHVEFILTLSIAEPPPEDVPLKLQRSEKLSVVEGGISEKKAEYQEVMQAAAK